MEFLVTRLYRITRRSFRNCGRFPNSDGFGKSDFTSSSGKGTWSLEAPGIDGIKIAISGLPASGGGSNHGEPHFDQVGYGGVLLGHTWPYELYFGVGDPDEGAGIVFQLKR